MAVPRIIGMRAGVSRRGARPARLARIPLWGRAAVRATYAA